LCRCTDGGTNDPFDWANGRGQMRQPTGPRPSPTTHVDLLPLKALVVVVLAILVLAGVSFLVAAAQR
jgi:hypothetical protein